MYPYSRFATVFVILVLLAITIPLRSSAAVPCIGQETMLTPSEFAIQVSATPRSLEDIFVSSEPDQPATAVEASPAASTNEAENEVTSSTENIVRCLQYGDYATFSTLVTGDYRLRHVGAATPDNTDAAMADVESLRLLTVNDTWMLSDGRAAGEVELLLDGSRLLVTTLVFSEQGGAWYLDDSSLSFAADIDGQISITLDDETVSTSASEASANGAVLISIDNTGESSYRYMLNRLDGDDRATLVSGLVVGYGFAGPPDDSVIVLHNVEAGRYRIVLMPENPDLGTRQEVEFTLAK